MGKTVTPKYRVETIETDGCKNVYSWRCKGDCQGKGYGNANTKNLEAWRVAFNASFNAGGVNFHISKVADHVPHISRATLVLQATGEVVASTSMPMFEVVQ